MSESAIFRRMHFIIGIILGASLSSICLQSILFAHRGVLPGVPQTRRQRSAGDDSLAAGHGDREFNPFGEYEIHNLGHRLKAENLGPTTQEQHDHAHQDHKHFKPPRPHPVDHFDVYSDSSFLQDDNILRDIRARQLVHISVLSAETTLPNYGTATRITWGAQVSSLQFLYGADSGKVKRQHPLPQTVKLPDLPADQSYSFLHLSKVLQYLCEAHIDEFDWFTVVMDTTYIHAPALMRMIKTISTSSQVVLGLPLESVDNVCDVKTGLIISRSLLSNMCPRLHQCHNQPSLLDISLDFSQCLGHLAGIACSDASKAWPGLYHTCEGGCPDYSRLVAGSGIDTAFVGPVSTTDDFYRLHLHYTSLDIQYTQSEITNLGQQLLNTQKILNPRSWLSKNPADTFGAGLVVTGSEPFYEFIDGKGKVYKDDCQGQDSSDDYEMLEEGSSYQIALSIAKGNIGLKYHGMQSFAYRITKPGVGIEYQFYFIEEGKEKQNIKTQDKRKKMATDRVHQVTVLQEYGPPDIVFKEVKAVRPVHFVMTVFDDNTQVIDFLQSFEKICVDSTVHSCTLLVLFFHQVKNDQSENVSPVHQYLNNLQNKKMSGVIETTIETIEITGEMFKLPRTLQMIDTSFPPDALISIVTPNSQINGDFIYRCQLNTALGKEVYFPVTFQMFKTLKLINDTEDGDILLEQNGVWANSDYSTVCVYNSDLHELGSLPSGYKGLYDNFEEESELHVIRSPDPAVRKSWQSSLCPAQLDDESCRKSLKYENNAR